MNHVEFIQARIVAYFASPLNMLRITVSGTEGNQKAVDSLRNERLDQLKAKLLQVTLEHMGHDPQAKNFRGEASGLTANSTIVRAVKKASRKDEETEAPKAAAEA